MIELMRHSDTVLTVVLERAGRDEALTTERVKPVRQQLKAALTSLDTI